MDSLGACIRQAKGTAPPSTPRRQGQHVATRKPGGSPEARETRRGSSRSLLAALEEPSLHSTANTSRAAHRRRSVSESPPRRTTKGRSFSCRRVQDPRLRLEQEAGPACCAVLKTKLLQAAQLAHARRGGQSQPAKALIRCIRLMDPRRKHLLH